MKVVLFVVTVAMSAFAFAAPKDAYVAGYAAATYAKYAAATEQARELDVLIQAFVQNPTAESMEAAKTKWIEARKIYSETEVYRFFDGPIDDEDGPEGLINAWPLDEAYIDYVIGNPNAGIINNAAQYPVIDAALLMELNEKDGEKNISTGWHAIEFLLWGQDVSVNGPGKRPVTDYIEGQGQNAERRKAYLGVVSKLLVQHLEEVTAEWNPANKSNYAGSFVQQQDSFTKVIEAAKFLAGEELAMERMFVAYDTQFQEDEHSCFSDTTHNDIYYNYVGIKNVLTDSYNGVSFVSLVAAQNPALAEELSQRIAALDVQFLAMPGPFDQAILNQDTRDMMKTIIDDLRALAEKVGEGLALIQ